ncbi:MAG TPA: YihY/virulence factor BrkB family protein [Thermoanaerobaculia bacterium]|nr:YihY/virulence factor BrkB family protein [Thermoanaerobaculia bacterium]
MARWRKLVTDTITSWNDHDASTQSAALAFYTMFSLAPLLVVVIAVFGLAFGADAVRGEILTEFQGWMGKDAASLVQSILRTAAEPNTNRLAGILGIAILIFGASGVFVQLQQSLNRIWGVVPKPGAAIKSLLRKRMLSFAVVLGIGFLLVVSLILSTGLTALGDYLERRYQLPVALLHALNILASFLVVTLLFALIYRLLPDVKLTWRDVFLGAVVTSALFGAGKTLIGFYLGRTGAASAYGAAGSLVMLLSWVYYSALVFLLGAEFTRVYTHESLGNRPAPEQGAKRADTTRPEEKANAPRPGAAPPAAAQSREGPPAIGGKQPAAANPARRRQA